MNRTEALEMFFTAWESFHELPKKPGRHSLEHEAAAQRLSDAADVVRACPKNQTAALEQPKPGEALANVRGMLSQIADIPPRDGFKPNNNSMG